MGTVEPSLRLAHAVSGLTLLPVSQLADQHLTELWACIAQEPDQRCWTYLPYTGFAHQAELQQALTQQFYLAGAQHYVVVTAEGAVGWIALLNLRPEHAVVEIGNVYFSPRLKHSIAATATLYVLLAHCFAQGYRRVEWKCDELNAPSKAAALRFGFQYEGTFRQDRITKGRNRNTAWFSMLDHEWSSLALAYQAWLAADNFDPQGQQKGRLQDFKVLYAAF
ncbi:GNAT family N-acetyltransferase [Acinetobacter larvae]|uniref:GNAT family N-acetyltransferase n=1 Tax=Acinetobacter larvae TaxID=1789224 RepID=A0A1B2M3Q9_9GAMM|nr:GNAT family N-acetyltransferase [Acinetobacter larvae]